MSENKNDANKQILEAFYRRIGEAHINNIIKDIEDKKEDIKKVKIPETLKNRLYAFFKEWENKKKRERNLKLIKRIASRVAIILLVMITTMTVITFSVEAVRVKVFNWFLDNKDKYTEIKVEESTEDTILGYYYPSYLPEGYKVVDNQDLKMIRAIHFVKDDNVIEFIQAENESNIQLDTENAETKNIYVNKEESILIVKDERVTIFWNNDEMSFSLTGYLDVEEMTKIAENIEKK
jgi:hypothetical protein